MHHRERDRIEELVSSTQETAFYIMVDWEFCKSICISGGGDLAEFRDASHGCNSTFRLDGIERFLRGGGFHPSQLYSNCIPHRDSRASPSPPSRNHKHPFD